MADLKRVFSSFNFYNHILGSPFLEQLANYWDAFSNKRLTQASFEIDKLVPQIKDELMRAWEKHGHLNSAHEGYAVLLEEMDELKEHVWMKQSERNMEEMGKEALQVAAMAMKFYVDIIAEDNRR